VALEHSVNDQFDAGGNIFLPYRVEWVHDQTAALNSIEANLIAKRGDLSRVFFGARVIDMNDQREWTETVRITNWGPFIPGPNPLSSDRRSYAANNTLLGLQLGIAGHSTWKRLYLDAMANIGGYCNLTQQQGAIFADRDYSNPVTGQYDTNKVLFSGVLETELVGGVMITNNCRLGLSVPVIVLFRTVSVSDAHGEPAMPSRMSYSGLGGNFTCDF
jgi:hypothetical protein